MSRLIFPQSGIVVKWTNNTGSSATVGVPILLGARIGIPMHTAIGNSTQFTIPNGVTTLLYIKGAFRVAKASAESFSVGASLYWNNSLKILTLSSAGNTYAGWSFEDAGSGTSTVLITIND